MPDLHDSKSSPSSDHRLPLGQFHDPVIVVPSLRRSSNDASKLEIFSVETSPLEKAETISSPSDDHVGALPGGREPLIRSGKDISDFVVDVRDDGDVCLTFRSLFLGTIFAGLAAAIAQVCHSRLRCFSLLITWAISISFSDLDIQFQANLCDDIAHFFAARHLHCWKCLGSLSSDPVGRCGNAP